jgi:hypothetical protein
MATLAALAGFAVAMVAGADHEARSLRERGLAGFAVAMAAGADHEARSLRSQVAALLHRNG